MRHTPGVVESLVAGQHLLQVLQVARYVGIVDQYGIEAHGPNYQRHRLPDVYRSGEQNATDVEWEPGSFHAERYGEVVYYADEAGGDPIWAFTLGDRYDGANLWESSVLTAQLRHPDLHWLHHPLRTRG